LSAGGEFFFPTATSPTNDLGRTLRLVDLTDVTLTRALLMFDGSSVLKEREVRNDPE
jgi:hypothetical protein